MSSIKGHISSLIENEYLIDMSNIPEIPKTNFRIYEDRLEDEEPIICARFGCGKKLTLREQLFGKHCSEHNGNKPIDYTRVLKFK